MPGDAEDPELARLRAQKENRYRRVSALRGGGLEWPEGPVPVDTAAASDALKRFPLAALEFWAGWCRPCIALKPVIEELAAVYWGDVAFLKLNLDDNPDAREVFGVTVLPTIIVAKHAQEVARLQGALTRRKLESELAPFAAAPDERARRTGKSAPPGP